MSNNKVAVAPGAGQTTSTTPPGIDDNKPKVAGGRALSTSANVLRLLPTGAVLAFQTLATSFTNQGDCLRSNWWLTLGLVTFLTAVCIFSSFTDTMRNKADGKLYHGVALTGRLHVFNLSRKQQRSFAAELRKRGLKTVDWVHAFFAAVVFLTIAGSDVGLQNCFFPNAGEDTKQLLRNLPLGMAVLSSFVFMIFPTKRRGIGFSNTDYSTAAAADAAASDKPSSKDGESSGGKTTATQPLGPATSANLLTLLPAGAVLAFQALAATFTNQGSCHRSNWWLTLGLVVFLTATCIFFAFTDSVTDASGNVHQGVAVPGRLYILNMSRQEQKAMAAELKQRPLKPVDWVHGLFTAVAFLTIAGNDVGLQNCFFPDADDNTKQLLKNLPLGMTILSSFIFMIFPPTRKGIGFDNSEYNVIEGGGAGAGTGTAKKSNDDIEASQSSPNKDTTTNKSSS